MTAGFKAVQPTPTFERDFKRLDPQNQREVEDCLRDLLRDVIPGVRRFHCIDQNRPKVYSIDLNAQKTHKISFQIEGATVILRRVGTHRVIDRSC